MNVEKFVAKKGLNEILVITIKLACCLQMLLMTVMVNLWWPDNPVSTVVLFLNIPGLFVRIRSIGLGLCGFL